MFFTSEQFFPASKHKTFYERHSKHKKSVGLAVEISTSVEEAKKRLTRLLFFGNGNSSILLFNGFSKLFHKPKLREPIL